MAELDNPVAGTTPPPERVGRAMAMRLMLEGASAAKAGKPMADVPHDGESDDPVERASAQAWLRGYVSAKRAAAAAERALGGPPPG